jgi:hypothetical protein
MIEKSEVLSCEPGGEMTYPATQNFKFLPGFSIFRIRRKCHNELNKYLTHLPQLEPVFFEEVRSSWLTYCTYSIIARIVTEWSFIKIFDYG